jgi:LmbE family N-acetylglucosaminyl deacetylase
MKNGENIVCIFAHPDDEAFGPSGTIAKWAMDNNVYLVCVTDGSDSLSGTTNLKDLRKKELLRSGEILGIKKIYFLQYRDGELNNNIYHKVVSDIEKVLDKIKPSRLLTFELHGVSGHIDHVFTSMVASFLYLKKDYIKKIFYFAEKREFTDLQKDYFIYFPDGYKKDEIDHVENIEKVWDKKVRSIKAHGTQKKDGDWILSILRNKAKDEWFIVREK